MRRNVINQTIPRDDQRQAMNDEEQHHAIKQAIRTRDCQLQQQQREQAKQAAEESKAEQERKDERAAQLVEELRLEAEEKEEVEALEDQLRSKEAQKQEDRRNYDAVQTELST